MQISLPKALLNLDVVDELASSNRIIRNLSVSNASFKEFAWIGDAVLRLVVPWEEGLVAELEGREIIHKSANFYYDTEESEVALRWPDGRKLVVSWLKKPENFPPLTPYLYVRDQPAMAQSRHPHCATKAWVIHARLLVEYPAAFVWRLWRNPFVLWNRGLLGQFLFTRQNLKKLWRGGELQTGRRWYVFGLWPLQPRQSLDCSIKIDCL